MSFTNFTRPLISFAMHAQWTFHNADGSTEIIYQDGPSLNHPKEVAKILKAAANPDEKPEDYVRDCDRVRSQRRGIAPKNPVALRMWLVWDDLFVLEDVRNKLVTARPTSKRGFVWEVWTGDQTEAGFQMYDHVGVVVPLYDIKRTTLDKLIEALGAGDELAATLELLK